MCQADVEITRVLPHAAQLGGGHAAPHAAVRVMIVAAVVGVVVVAVIMAFVLLDTFLACVSINAACVPFALTLCMYLAYVHAIHVSQSYI